MARFSSFRHTAEQIGAKLPTCEEKKVAWPEMGLSVGLNAKADVRGLLKPSNSTTASACITAYINASKYGKVATAVGHAFQSHRRSPLWSLCHLWLK